MEETNEIDKLDLSPRAFRVVHGIPLLAEMKIELGEDRTIGQYIRELLTIRNKKRIEHISNILLLLENEAFLYQICPNHWSAKILCFMKALL